jgi:hypothetical protein
MTTCLKFLYYNNRTLNEYSHVPSGDYAEDELEVKSILTGQAASSLDTVMEKFSEFLRAIGFTGIELKKDGPHCWVFYQSALIDVVVDDEIEVEDVNESESDMG